MMIFTTGASGYVFIAVEEGCRVTKRRIPKAMEVYHKVIRKKMVKRVQGIMILSFEKRSLPLVVGRLGRLAGKWACVGGGEVSKDPAWGW
jgi:hypothetical protein